MDVNVVAAADPIQSKAQFLQQALQVPESNVASALLDALDRLFWARHGSLPSESESLTISPRDMRQPSQWARIVI